MQRPLAPANRASSPRRQFLTACLALATIAGCAACNPTFNWREFRSPDGFAVVFPGRPQTVSREIKLPDGVVQMSMTSTGVGATLFAVGAASCRQMRRTVGPATNIEHLRDALVRNVNGTITQSSAAALFVPASGSRTVLAAEVIEAAGRDPGGHAVQLAARLFIVEDRVFQVVALGANGEIPSDALDTFFASFRLI